ncbi:MAG TPA: TIGR00159 family protein [Clostridiales bacterium UBA8153]|nr:TIGR00159 family protein [Clostridiales bacterium UBA8153]
MLEHLRFLSLRDVLGAAVDIAIVAYVLYRFFMLIRGTRAIQLLKGIAILLLATTISQFLRLYTITWILSNARLMLAVALPVVFQPELRRFLEQIGRGKFFAGRSPLFMGEVNTARMIEELVKAVGQMSRNRTGALIVLEREIGLNDFVETGIGIDGLVSSEFLVNIFVPNTPLHDGAVILRGDRVQAAACFLPLTDSVVGTEMGGRHRAALGITEVSDSLAVIVSEETGTISLANAGRIIRHIDLRTLSEMLTASLQPKATSFWNRGAAAAGKVD